MAQIEEMQNYIMQKRQIAQAVYLESNTPIANQLSEIGEVTYISRYSSVIICDLTKSEAVDVAMKNNVLSLTNGEIKGKDYMVSSNQAFGIAYPHSLGASAQGINIGMIESGVPDLTQSCFNGISNKIDTDGIVSDHASWVAAIMVGNQHGIARGFNKLCAFGIGDGQEHDDEWHGNRFLEGVETLLSEGVNVINASCGLEQWADRDEYADWLDHIAYNHSVHFVAAIGNLNDDQNIYRTSNIAMAYNVISVGAVSDGNTPNYLNDDSWWFGSCYYADTTSTCAYKPDLCAYGENISIPNTTIQSDAPNGAESGTSASAPYVTGLVAVLCSIDPDLLVAQDQMKAILTASTVKAVHNYNTSDEEYRMYGAGIANAKNATFLIQAGTYQGGSITNSESRDYISLGTIPAGTTVTVSLSFLRRHRLLGSEHEDINSSFLDSELPDLDIYIAPVIAMPG
ncbi:MAG: S8/S53 family peptidase, partial [Clostridia bacterium]|nr:S8/S53 family peptidase [Clostridia bacterium]